MSRKTPTVEIPLSSLEEMALFLVASAEGLFQEPQEYGPLRLLQGVTRIARLLEDRVPHPFLEAKAREIDENIETVMEDEDAFRRFVSGLVLDFTRDRIQNE
jgi:hypothetical protein